MKRPRFSRLGWAIRVVPPLCLVAVLAPVISAQHEAWVGRWELNVEKSTFSPGPPPRRQTLTFQAVGPQWMAVAGDCAVRKSGHSRYE